MNDYVTKPFEEKELFNTIVQQLHWNTPNIIKTPTTINNNYDLTQLRALSRGDEDFVRNMVEIFLQHTPSALGTMQSALLEKDYSNLAKIAHRIKPSIESMGIKQLDGVAKDIELTAKAKATVDHARLTERVHFLSNTLSVVFQKLKEDFT